MAGVADGASVGIYLIARGFEVGRARGSKMKGDVALT